MQQGGSVHVSEPDEPGEIGEDITDIVKIAVLSSLDDPHCDPEGSH